MSFCIYFIHDLIIHVKLDHDNHHRRDTISCHHNQRFGGDEMQLPTKISSRVNTNTTYLSRSEWYETIIQEQASNMMP